MAVTGRKRQEMTRFWRIAAVLSALCVVLAAMAVGASAAKLSGGKGTKKAKATGARVDTSYGSKGVAKIATGGKYAEGKVHMALESDGRSYALQGNLLLAFEPNGKPARDFGNNGRLRITSDRGELSPADVAVDSQGRVLVDGGFLPYPFSQGQDEVFVDRYLPDGSLDPAFGNDGEATTTFGAPLSTAPSGGYAHIRATTLGVDPEERPIVGGAYASAVNYCHYQYTSLVGRLTTSGTLDTSYGGKGYVAEGKGEVKALSETPEGGVVTLSVGIYCGAREEIEPSTFASLTESGEPNPAVGPTPVTLQYNDLNIAVDSRGRSLVVQSSNPYTEEPLLLTRLLSSGVVDASFGSRGVSLGKEVTPPGAIAVDAKNRTLVVQSAMQHPYGPRLVRYTAAGRLDPKFGHDGLLEGAVVNDKRGGVNAMAIDAKGRIYTAGWVESKTLKTGHGIQITRFLPGK
jgi:uncharacterized delta-60 repeat protein